MCTETTSDADGDTVSVTYEWLINGALQNSSSNSLTVSWEVNTQVTCRVTPHDGSEFGLPVEASTVVQKHTTCCLKCFTVSKHDLHK